MQLKTVWKEKHTAAIRQGMAWHGMAWHCMAGAGGTPHHKYYSIGISFQKKKKIFFPTFTRDYSVHSYGEKI